jgi:hypothetical protein
MLKNRIALSAVCAAIVAVPAAAQVAEMANEIIVSAQQKQKQVVGDGSIGVLGHKSALEAPFNVTT